MCACFLVFAADSLGRRKSLLWTSVAMSLSMLYVGEFKPFARNAIWVMLTALPSPGLYVRIEPPQEGVPVPPAGYFALVCICKLHETTHYSDK